MDAGLLRVILGTVLVRVETATQDLNLHKVALLSYMDRSGREGPACPLHRPRLRPSSPQPTPQQPPRGPRGPPRLLRARASPEDGV